MTSVAGTLPFQFDPSVIWYHRDVLPVKVILVRLLQLQNAEVPMLVTLSPMVTLVRVVQ